MRTTPAFAVRLPNEEIQVIEELRRAAMKRKFLKRLAAFIVVIAVVMNQRLPGQAGGKQASRQAPIFQVDTAWLKLPQNWVLGQGSAVAVDKHDHVWILHRPLYVGTLYEKPAGKKIGRAHV